ncbi:hypothetical protein [Bosea sp. F3-2]|uniref:hypothetical protein n=1 Tax=Bosea sp. F3-2 TaxID=2599640 RepID=UPI0016551C4E|nr:hypothetical protein [Bosea sp. F3-2]
MLMRSITLVESEGPSKFIEQAGQQPAHCRREIIRLISHLSRSSSKTPTPCRMATPHSRQKPRIWVISRVHCITI